MKICPQCSQTFDDRYNVCPNDHVELISNAGDQMIGRLLDNRYRMTKKIGEGGMGAIYTAVHTEMGRTCAIKLLTAITTGHEEALARFKREAKMASRIDNPHAVTIYDYTNQRALVVEGCSFWQWNSSMDGLCRALFLKTAHCQLTAPFTSPLKSPKR